MILFFSIVQSFSVINLTIDSNPFFIPLEIYSKNEYDILVEIPYFNYSEKFHLNKGLNKINIRINHLFLEDKIKTKVNVIYLLGQGNIVQTYDLFIKKKCYNVTLKNVLLEDKKIEKVCLPKGKYKFKFWKIEAEIFIDKNQVITPIRIIFEKIKYLIRKYFKCLFTNS